MAWKNNGTGITKTYVLINLLPVTNSVALGSVSLASKMGIIIRDFEDPSKETDSVLPPSFLLLTLSKYTLHTL